MRNPRTTPTPAYLCISGEHSRLLLLAGAFALLPFSMYAQSTKAALFGTVHDASGATLGNTQVTLVSTLTHATRTAQTPPAPSPSSTSNPRPTRSPQRMRALRLIRNRIFSSPHASSFGLS
jgi:hypothetical protein